MLDAPAPGNHSMGSRPGHTPTRHAKSVHRPASVASMRHSADSLHGIGAGVPLPLGTQLAQQLKLSTASVSASTTPRVKQQLEAPGVAWYVQGQTDTVQLVAVKPWAVHKLSASGAQLPTLPRTGDLVQISHLYTGSSILGLPIPIMAFATFITGVTVLIALSARH